MRKVKISVTRRHIDQGEPKHSDRCAIALAMSEAIGRKTWVTLGPPTASEYPLPESAARFIKRFDAGLPVRPFTFTVEVPDGR